MVTYTYYYNYEFSVIKLLNLIYSLSNYTYNSFISYSFSFL